MTATAPIRPVRSDGAAPRRGDRVGAGILDPRQMWRTLPQALRKLDPGTLWRNPVMFVTEVGAALTTGLAIAHPTVFGWLITLRPSSSSALLTRNLGVYGLGGVIVPFLASKFIDVALVQFIPGI